MAEEKRESYTRLFNPILEALYKQASNLSSNDYAIILFIIRGTYGWHKTRYPMSAGYISKGTGIPERSVKRSLKKLLEKHYIIDYGKDQDSRSKLFGLNKKFSQWNKNSVTDDTVTHDTLTVSSEVKNSVTDDTLEGVTDDTQKRKHQKKEKKKDKRNCSPKEPFLNPTTGMWEFPEDE